MINLSCGQHMMLLNNTPVHVCCVDMAELCVSCGNVSQKGNRRVVFRDSNCSHLTIYAANFSLCDEAESVLKLALGQSIPIPKAMVAITTRKLESGIPIKCII